MAKEFGSIASFVGKDVIINMVKKGTEEITGTVKSVKDNIVTLIEVSRGSTYTHRIPATDKLYVKASEETELAKGVEACVEMSINKLIKIKGTIVGADANGIMVDRGEVRGANVHSYIAYSKIDSIDHRELTADGKRASAEKSARMKAAKSGKKSSKVEKSGKSGKKLKLLKKKAA
jgi:hypothetical protein